MEDTLLYDQEHLKTLNFHPHARPSADEIKKRWKDLCKEHHPDKGGDAEQFNKITQAYELMTNPEARKNYKNSTPKISLDFRIHMSLTFEEAVFGTSFMLNYAETEFADDLTTVKKDPLEIISIRVNVLPCSFENTEIMFQGKGFKKDGEVGNTVVVLSSLKSRVYRVESQPSFAGFQHTIVMDHGVPLHQMLKGARIQVKTLVGIKTLRVPPGSKDGDRLAVPNSIIAGTNVGHVVVLKLIYPTKHELRNGKEWKPLDIQWTEEDDEKPFARQQGMYYITFAEGLYDENPR